MPCAPCTNRASPRDTSLRLHRQRKHGRHADSLADRARTAKRHPLLGSLHQRVDRWWRNRLVGPSSAQPADVPLVIRESTGKLINHSQTKQIKTHRKNEDVHETSNLSLAWILRRFLRRIRFRNELHVVWDLSGDWFTAGNWSAVGLPVLDMENGNTDHVYITNSGANPLTFSGKWYCVVQYVSEFKTVISSLTAERFRLS